MGSKAFVDLPGGEDYHVKRLFIYIQEMRNVCDGSRDCMDIVLIILLIKNTANGMDTLTVVVKYYDLKGIKWKGCFHVSPRFTRHGKL
jgi:hypothetical protein